jgi:hypothetical protein
VQLFFIYPPPLTFALGPTLLSPGPLWPLPSRRYTDSAGKRDTSQSGSSLGDRGSWWQGCGGGEGREEAPATRHEAQPRNRYCGRRVRPWKIHGQWTSGAQWKMTWMKVAGQRGAGSGREGRSRGEPTALKSKRQLSFSAEHQGPLDEGRTNLLPRELVRDG